MTLKDLLRKKDKVKQDDAAPSPDAAVAATATAAAAAAPPGVPEFTFMRTTTTSQELISPPSFPGDRSKQQSAKSGDNRGKHLSIFRRPSSHGSAGPDSPKSPRSDRRFSELLHLGGQSRSNSSCSVNLPPDLPEIDEDVARSAEQEAQWEKRATILAKGTLISKPGNAGEAAAQFRPPSAAVSDQGGDKGGDDNIQEAIRLHEAGDLERSTEMFCKLADPNGANHALSQVLYGLALRHGWGCPPNPELAITYLSYAAQNSAEIESLALSAGMKKGGSAKGELVLAMFELANSFRHGWGVKKDAAAARQYYETAANLGDTDAMNEAAWCYVEGFGGKKDKFKAAQLLRLAEEKGNKTIGNTWIWKEKYNPKPQ